MPHLLRLPRLLRNAGTRLLGNVAISLVVGQEPAVTLATQAAIAALSTIAPQYCTQPLLADPVSHQRMLGLATALEYASVPLVFLSPPARQLLAHPAVLSGARPLLA